MLSFKYKKINSATCAISACGGIPLNNFGIYENSQRIDYERYDIMSCSICSVLYIKL